MASSLIVPARLVDHKAVHQRTQLEKVAGWQSQRQQVQALERKARFDDDKTIGGKDSFIIQEKPLDIRTSMDTALIIRQEEGLVQFQFGTQDSGAGTPNPIFLMGPDITDIFTFMIKMFGLRGDIIANGLLDSANVNIAKNYSSVHKDANAVTLSTDGMPAVTTTAFTDDDTTNGTWGRYVTAATSGDVRGWFGPLSYLTAWEIEAEYRIQLVDLANVRIWIGLFQTDPSGSTTINSQNYAAFRFVGGIDTNWQAVCCDGAANTRTDTGVPVAAGLVNLRLRLSASEAQFIIGLPNVGAGTTTTTITTNLPSSSTYLAPYFRLTTLVNVAKAIRFNLFNCLSQ